MDWKSVRYPLKHPVTIGEKTYSAINLREPDVDALEKIDSLGIDDDKDKKLGVKDLRVMISALADVPDAVIGKLHKDDFLALAEEVTPLVEDGSEKTATEPSS